MNPALWLPSVLWSPALAQQTPAPEASLSPPVQDAPVQADPASGPARVLSVEEAIELALSSSESLQVAEAGVDKATGEQWVARSGYLPQVIGSLTYQRTFETEFDDLFSGFGPPTGAFPTGTPTGTPPGTTTPTTPPTGTGTGTTTGGGGAGQLPFGQPNTWRVGVTINQGIYGGGRTGALNKMAAAGSRAAEISLESTRAQVALETASAYYDAALSGRLLEIALSSLEQAKATLAQTQLGSAVGRQPEFDLLRAQVTVENQEVAVINARRQRDIAYQRLAQIVDLPPGTPLELSSPLEGDTSVADAATRIAGAKAAGTPRAPVRQLTENAEAVRRSVALARSEALPQLGASVSLGWVSFPQELWPIGEGKPWYASSSGSVSLNVPLFNGGRVWGSVMKARADVASVEAQLEQTRELAELDTQQAEASLAAARAQWAATEGVVEQARRAYEIAELRFNEGVSTQIELSDARLQLEQALVNRAMAARDLAVAETRIALLASLPLQAGF